MPYRCHNIHKDLTLVPRFKIVTDVTIKGAAQKKVPSGGNKTLRKA